MLGFQTTPCTFLELNEGGVLGNTIKATYSFQGIFKDERGMSSNNNMELKESTSRLHINPSEPFVLEGELVGHGVRVTKNGNTEDYRIIGVKEGHDFDTGITEFLWLTLKAESLAEYGESS